MPTQKDVARIAGVSIASVSRYLNKSGYISKSTEIKIISAIKETGYRINFAARSLKSRRSGTIGCIFPDIENPFFIGFIKEIEQIFRTHGYNVILCNTENNADLEHAAIKMLLSRLIEGYLIIPCQKKLNTSLELLSDARLVLVDRRPRSNNIPSVTLDNKRGVFLAVEYLYKLGHKYIGMVNVPQHTYTGRERKGGFDNAIKHFSLPDYSEYQRIADFTSQSAYDATIGLLSCTPRPTALIPMSGLTTVGTLKAVRNMGSRVPKDISIVGFDDFMYADLFNPPLTTVVQPAKQFADAATNLLLKILRGERPEQRQIVLQPRLRIRDSCSTPP